MSRAKWKGPFFDNLFFNKIITNNTKIYSRGSTIPFFLVDKTVLVHNGKVFKKIFITREKVGFKFGEFCFTRHFRPKIVKK